MTAQLAGQCAAAFDRVSETARRIVASNAARGLAVSVWRRGELAVDIVAGEYRPNAPWRPSTFVPLTSISKTVIAAAALTLVDERQLDPARPVSAYWPEFAANGKAQVTVGELLSHEAGIPLFNPPITLHDQQSRRPIIQQIENARPLWCPGSDHGYHALTWGYAVSELLNRITRAPFGQFIHERVCSPLEIRLSTMLDPPELDNLARVAVSVHGTSTAEIPSERRAYVEGYQDPSSLLFAATFGSSAITPEQAESPDYFLVERPNLYATAHDVCVFYSALARRRSDGGLLNDNSFALASRARSTRIDRVFRVPTAYSLGFMTPVGPLWPPCGKTPFGHIGSTGSVAFADPASDLAFVFLTNSSKSIYQIPDTRAEALTEAVYQSLKEDKGEL
jgi:CubicO group peptidase (beta-lactamase class C family)